MIRARLAVFAYVGTSFCASSIGNAADIKLLFPVTMVPAMSQLIPEFERLTGHKVTSAFANIGALTDRVQKGEVADIVIVSPAQVESLLKAGRVIAGSQTVVATTPIVVIVRKGSPKPDIRSLEAFKHALRQAKSIAFNNPATGGPVGVYAAALLDRLAMTDELKSKIRLTPNGVTAVNQYLSTGVAEIAFTQTSELVAMPDVDLVGPLPEPIQHATVFAAVIVASGSEPNAGAALIQFVASPAAKPAFKAIGME